MKDQITIRHINKFNNNFNKNINNISSRNALIKNDLNNVALNWDSFSKINHSFSHTGAKELPVTDQKASGPC